CTLVTALLQITQQSLVGEVERVRVFPVVVSSPMQPFDNLVVASLNSQFAAIVETARSQIYRAVDGAESIGQKHHPVKLEVLQFMDFYPNIVHDAQPSDPLHKLVLL